MPQNDIKELMIDMANSIKKLNERINAIDRDPIRVVVKDTSGYPSAVSGVMVINVIDNKVSMYADGGWRDLATW